MAGIYSKLRRNTYTPTFLEICRMAGISPKNARKKVLDLAKTPLGFDLDEDGRMSAKRWISHIDEMLEKINGPKYSFSRIEIVLSSLHDHAIRNNDMVAMVAAIGIILSKCRTEAPKNAIVDSIADPKIQGIDIWNSRDGWVLKLPSPSYLGTMRFPSFPCPCQPEDRIMLPVLSEYWYDNVPLFRCIRTADEIFRLQIITSVDMYGLLPDSGYKDRRLNYIRGRVGLSRIGR